ncbi:hypothetical protein [Streptomyces sp. BK239]|uniref:hypothetical protein n=1 Tax=Streptomyces sp. BK239 TaxID=2512155 RepID=UPI001F5EC702|nr:hypothetical protein [Streptomyces sp. BK239]
MEHVLSLADRHLTYLMRQIATRNAFVLMHPFAELKTFAAQVYVAECYGFRYERVELVGRQRMVHVHLVRDPSPAARQRAAVNSAAFPDLGPGRPVPGMRPGTLTPLPEAQADVDLLTDLIRYEGLGHAANQAQLKAIAWGSAVFFALLAALSGKYAVCLTIAVLLPLGALGVLRFNTARRAKLAERLTAAGCTTVRDAEGQERFVRPERYAV